MAGLVLTLDIRVMTGLRRQQFLVPVDLTGPATLKILPGQFGIGNTIEIIDEEGELRQWYAQEIFVVKFEFGMEPDESAPSAEEVGVLSMDRGQGKEMWYMHLLLAAERM
jgi:hypothetical protein